MSTLQEDIDNDRTAFDKYIAEHTAHLNEKSVPIACFNKKVFEGCDLDCKRCDCDPEKIETKVEEKCPACKRMKDLGKKCWWCGL